MSMFFVLLALLVSEADDRQLRVYDEVEVRERADDLVGIAASATEGSTGIQDLARRPILRPGELIETTPGVVATQHSGGGKGNQYFVRGFNLDHGTDFSLRVAGVPVNMPTHGHGQGYADLNFVIPETVERVRFRKGPYFADVGDFSAAGGADMTLVHGFSGPLLKLTGGSFGDGRALFMNGFETDGGEGVFAVELFEENGPWTREDEYQGFKGLFRYGQGDAQRGYTLTFMGYDADWLSTDQVPQRAVNSGLIGRFDLIDPGPRGSTQRFSLSAEVRRGSDTVYSTLNAYVLSYDFNLFSNFTYFLEDEDNGDQFEQVDDRLALGFDLRRTRLTDWQGNRVELSAGAGARFDDITNGLFRTSDLQRFGTVRTDDVQQISGGVWADALIHWTEKVHLKLGLRGDAVSVDVASDLGINSGTQDDVLVSPKLSLILGPWNSTEIYLNFGGGFHSNDARGAVIAVDPTNGEPVTQVDLLVPAKGADIGLRTSLTSRSQTTLSVFMLELDSELVFVGDGGATEANRPSQRTGVELSNFFQLNDHMAFDFDLTLTDAEFTDTAPEGDEIPGAVGTTIAAGLSFDDIEAPGGQEGELYGALRWRYFGDVPLIEDGSVEWDSSSTFNARLGWRFANGADVAIDVFNLLDSDDSDVQYFYGSRLPGEPSGGFEDVHFHPLAGRSARLTFSWRWGA